MMNFELSLNALSFDNAFTRELPADLQTENTTRQVLGACYSWVKPQKVAAPRLISYASEVAELLDLNQESCESPLFTQVFSGNELVSGMQPYAMCYGGHQFGNWAGQLGDGRAINLGEVVNHQGQHFTLQLKGAGKTPYSRHADGLAVLRSSVREFLCSEAMHHLGIPTTRALSLISTGELVIRDMFYDGRARAEPGAIVCRVAPSFIRFGNFEILADRGEKTLLKQLVEYTLQRDFPELGTPSVETYLNWFTEICSRTVTMIVEWQRVGFVHGVMNTDNMSILGLTLDYGPYGWLEDYNPDWTPNTTDAREHRYCFGNQPQIAFWNLEQLAIALYPLIQSLKPLQQILTMQWQQFTVRWQNMQAAKLGFQNYQAETDAALINELLEILCLVETDMTLFYRQLALIPLAEMANANDETLVNFLVEAYYTPDALTVGFKSRIAQWLRHYAARINQEATTDTVRRERMNAVNPVYVLRNYLAQMAIDKAETGDFSMINELLAVLRHPYTLQTGKEAFAEKRPEWARHRAGCSMLSCSS